MKTRKVNVLLALIVTLFIASFASRALAQTPAVGIVTSKDSIALGEEVTVNVTVTNMPEPGLYSYELKLRYNNTLLNATAASIPTDHMLKPSLSPSNIFIVIPGEINQTQGIVSFAVTMLGAEPGKVGNGRLVTVTFEGLAMGNSTFELYDVILVDADTNSVETTLTPGTLEIVPEFAVIAMMAIFTAMSGVAVALRKKLK